MMADLKMTLACWNYDRTRALMDGSVKPEGIELTYHSSFPAATFHRMMGKREFEASELGLTFYLDTLHALLGDDWFPYGLKRNYKPLDTFLRYHSEQGLSKRRFKPKEWFLPETLDD
jgi:hypothetical protein